MKGEVLERETTHRGPVFDVEVIRFRDRDREVRRDVVRHPGAVTVVGLLDDGRLTMVRNYRISVDDRLLELPAGKLEPGEDATCAARRELEEETGYTAGAVRPIGSFYTSPGFADELMHVFEATDLREVGQRLEVGEDIELVHVSVSDALAMARDGRIVDGKTIAALVLWWGFSAERTR